MLSALSLVETFISEADQVDSVKKWFNLWCVTPAALEAV